MIQILLFAIVLIGSFETTKVSNTIETPEDSSRLAELDRFMSELSRTVREGDYEGYKATYHDDAVVIFATGENKVSLPVSKALDG